MVYLLYKHESEMINDLLLFYTTYDNMIHTYSFMRLFEEAIQTQISLIITIVKCFCGRYIVNGVT